MSSERASTLVNITMEMIGTKIFFQISGWAVGANLARRTWPVYWLGTAIHSAYILDFATMLSPSEMNILYTTRNILCMGHVCK